MSVEWHPENFRQAYGYTYTSKDAESPGVFTYVSSEPLQAKRVFASDAARGVTLSPLERYVPESLLLAERARAERAVNAFEECRELWVASTERLHTFRDAVEDVVRDGTLTAPAVRKRVAEIISALRSSKAKP